MLRQESSLVTRRRGEVVRTATRRFAGTLGATATLLLFTWPLWSQAGPTSPKPRTALGRCNVADFGAVGDDVHDDTAAFQDALATCSLVLVSGGTFRLTNTISIPPATELRGIGRASRLKFYTPVATGVRLGDGRSNSVGHGLRDLAVTGAGATAVLVDNALTSVVDNVVVDGAWADGFCFKNTWGSTFSHLMTSGNGISHASFTAGPVYNANFASNWYSSNNNVSYNFIIDGSGGASSSHGATFGMLTAQGGDVGLFVGDYRGLDISGLYVENVARPIILGDYEKSKKAISIRISGASIGGPNPTHRAYSTRVALIDISYAQSCVFDSIDLQGLYGVDDWVAMSVIGDGTGAVATARTRPDGSIHSVEVLSPGAGYTHARVVFSGIGHGAAATARVVNGKVANVLVAAPGAGYNAGVPVAVRYRAAGNILFNGWYLSSGARYGLASPLYPWIVRHPAATPGSGINVTFDHSYLTTAGAEARIVSPQGFGATLYRVEMDSSGRQIATPYSPPTFP